MSMSETEMSKAGEKDVTTVLAEDLDIKGTMKFTKSLMLKGVFEGEIISEGLLVVGSTADVKATIYTKNLVSHGTIQGDVTTEERIILKSTARHTGNLATPNLVIEDGSRFNGSCVMDSKGAASSGSGGDASGPETMAEPGTEDETPPDSGNGDTPSAEEKSETESPAWAADTDGSLSEEGGSAEDVETGKDISGDDDKTPDGESGSKKPGHIESHIESNSSVTFLKSFGMSGTRDKRKK